jgi:hypothetical protein
MTESSQGAQGASEEPREPFVSQGDRPEVQLNLDTPLSELRLRDLGDILWGPGGGKPLFSEKLIGQVEKIKRENTKIENLKLEKVEKFETGKPEKWEIQEVPGGFERPPGPNPLLNQLIQDMSGVTTQVSQLANQVAEIQRRLEG